MRFLVSYDISEDRVRNKVADLLERVLFRVQFSVFEGEAPEDRLQNTVRVAALMIDPEKDSIRVYRLCASCAARVDSHGREIKTEPEDVRIL